MVTSRTLANPRASPLGSPEESTDQYELELEAEFLEAEHLEAELRATQESASHKGASPTSANSPPELQLMLDANFL